MTDPTTNSAFFPPPAETAEGATVNSVPEVPPPPPSPEEVITTSPRSPRKQASPKVVATILGLALLLGGVATGVYLVQNQQLNIGRAQENCTLYSFEVTQEGKVRVKNASSKSFPAQLMKVFIDKQEVASCVAPELRAGDTAEICTVLAPSSGGFEWRVQGTKNCENSGVYEPKITPTPSPTPTVSISLTLTPSPSTTISPTPTIVGFTPTLTPTPSTQNNSY